MGISEGKQIIMVWWGLGFFIIFGLSYLLLLHVIPPPSPGMSDQEIATWYAERHTSIGIGAIITSWTAGFQIPLTVVIVLQMLRVEQGTKAWSILAAFGGAVMPIFLALPPIFWGAAAYESDRAPAATAVIHQVGHLTMWTTCQIYIFLWVAIAAVCLQPNHPPLSPFPRWFGYFTIWAVIMFEAGAIAYGPHSGPFAWDGLFVFWIPSIIYAFWMGINVTLLLRALKSQREDDVPSASSSETVQPTGASAPA